MAKKEFFISLLPFTAAQFGQDNWVGSTLMKDLKSNTNAYPFLFSLN